MKFPKFLFFQIEEGIQNNFELVRDWLLAQDTLKFGMRFFEFSVPAAVTNYAIPHPLRYKPLDILTTKATGSITFHYDSFTDKFIYITTTGPVSFRGLIGRFAEDK